MLNCGECRQKTCMPFAFALLRGEAEIAECTRLNAGAIEELKSSISRSDWREELISKLRKEIESINFTDVAAGLGACLKDGNMIVRSLGRELVITPGGEISAEGRITPWTKILLLHYIRTHGKAPLSGKWISYSELKSGMVKASSFRRECEDPLRDMLDSDPEAVPVILHHLGAEAMGGFASKYAWHLFLLPKIPVLILYWPREDEFESKVSVLFDSTADQFLDVESIMFLGEGLIENIESHLRHGNGDG